VSEKKRNIPAAYSESQLDSQAPVVVVAGGGGGAIVIQVAMQPTRRRSRRCQG
jgi:hypothetical protein